MLEKYLLEQAAPIIEERLQSKRYQRSEDPWAFHSLNETDAKEIAQTCGLTEMNVIDFHYFRGFANDYFHAVERRTQNYQYLPGWQNEGRKKEKEGASITAVLSGLFGGLVGGFLGKWLNHPEIGALIGIASAEFFAIRGINATARNRRELRIKYVERPEELITAEFKQECERQKERAIAYAVTQVKSHHTRLEERISVTA